jgi:tetratricopeptide (TPR) repeat protein
VNGTDKREGKRRHELVESGDYEGALASADEAIAKQPEDGLLYRERGHLHLYLHWAQQARADFDVTARLAEEVFRTKPGRLHADSEYNAIGVTYWMQGHVDLAVAFWRYTTNLLSKNRVAYAHTGGGIESGLHLWFGAVHQHNADDIKLVRRLFEQRLASTLWTHNLTRWPGPLVHFFLKRIDEAQLIESASQRPQELCYAHFAVAIRARELRRHAAYWKHLKLAAPCEGPKELYEHYNVFPYFLARFELLKHGK